MKLTTIWTLRGMPLRERLARTVEWAVQSAAHRLPRRLAYWSYIDTTARYTFDHPTAPVVELPALEVVDWAGKRWGRP